MKSRRLVQILIVIALALWSLSASALDALIEIDGEDYVGRIVVITDPTPIPSEHCFESWSDYQAVIINPGGGPAMITEVSIAAGADVRPGDRFSITDQGSCDASYWLVLEPE